MKPSNRSPSYLIRHDHSYCFRMRIPPDLHRLTGKKELRYSLKTGYVGIAKTKARFLAGHIQLMFRMLRKRYVTVLGKLSEDKIKEPVEQYTKHDEVVRLQENLSSRCTTSGVHHVNTSYNGRDIR